MDRDYPRTQSGRGSAAVPRLEKIEHAEVTHITAREVYRVRWGSNPRDILTRAYHDNIPAWSSACGEVQAGHTSVSCFSDVNPTCRTCAVLLDEAREEAEEIYDA